MTLPTLLGYFLATALTLAIFSRAFRPNAAFRWTSKLLLGAGALVAFVKLVKRSADEVIPTGVPVGQLLAGTAMPRLDEMPRQWARCAVTNSA